jgi:hypothetical protein
MLIEVVGLQAPIFGDVHEHVWIAGRCIDVRYRVRRDYEMLLTNRCNTILRGTRVVVLSWHEWNGGGRWVATEIGEMPKSPDHEKKKGRGELHVMRLDVSRDVEWRSTTIIQI